jgi:hypothetical protein
VVIPFRIFVFVAVIAAGTLHAQGTVSGFVTINNDRFELNSVAAMLVPDSFDKTKTKVRTRMVLADKPVPQDVLDDQSQIWDLKTQGYHGLQIEFSEDRAYYSLLVISGTLHSSVSTSGTFDSKKLTISTGQRVAGALETKPDKVGEVTLSYSVKFDTRVASQDPAPTAADTVAAAGKESTQAYLALVAAIRAGDKQRMLDLSPPERRAAIDSPKFPEALRMIQSLTPQKIEILKATENGDRAKLIARGTSDDMTHLAKIYMNRVDGKWILITESWDLN